MHGFDLSDRGGFDGLPRMAQVIYVDDGMAVVLYTPNSTNRLTTCGTRYKFLINQTVE
jgi:hypothetical protein